MLNQCNFIGRVGRDPETRHTQDGKAVTNFTVACSESWKDKSGNKQEKTEWINCTAWGKLAEIIDKYVGKGMMIFVSGKIETQKWSDSDGVTKYKTVINVSEMKMLSGTNSKEDNDIENKPTSTGDDVPF